jgi:hypothetical protein
MLGERTLQITYLSVYKDEKFTENRSELRAAIIPEQVLKSPHKPVGSHFNAVLFARMFKNLVFGESKSIIQPMDAPRVEVALIRDNVMLVSVKDYGNPNNRSTITYMLDPRVGGEPEIEEKEIPEELEEKELEA